MQNLIQNQKEKTLKLENGVEISLIMPIIDAKRSFNRDKDVLDLMSISRMIYSQKEFESYLESRK